MSAKRLSPHHGVIVSMVTAVTSCGDLDEPAVRRIVDHMVAGGVHGIFVLGTTGENTSVPAAMRERFVALVVAHLPTYYALNAEEQFAYFSALADRIDQPLLLYDILVTTHMAIPVEVVGIKDSGGDAARLAALLERLGDSRPDFAILKGDHNDFNYESCL